MKQTSHKFQILFEDEHILAVNKHKGALTVASQEGQVNLTDSLKAHYAKQNIRIRPLNRLDRDTSGVVLFAKTKECYQKAIEEKLFADSEKTYLAVIQGIPKIRSGQITYELPSRQDQRRMLPAKTKYKVLEVIHFPGGSVCLVEAKIMSGRFHQIRRHFHLIHHPLFMDKEYITKKDFQFFCKVTRLRSYLLHAHKIKFKHFITGEELEIVSPPSKEYKKIKQTVGK